MRGPVSYADLAERGYLPADEAAQQMGVSVERLRALVQRGILRATPDGQWVQPAIVSGYLG